MNINKKSKYERLYSQLKPLLEESPGFIAQLATFSALLYNKINYAFWLGFYLLDDEQLIVGPYQGPLACQSLPYSKGVCWQAILQKKVIIVDNVSIYPDHIACDSRSKSEIVLPITNSDNKIIGVLDVDSNKIAAFDKDDESGLKNLLQLIKS